MPDVVSSPSVIIRIASKNALQKHLTPSKKSLESEQQAELLDRERGSVNTLGTQVALSYSDILAEFSRLQKYTSTRHEIHDHWYSQ